MTLGFSTFVRNEIHCLPELLDRIKGYFDEVVVVDTGSTDGTWETLRAREKLGELRPYKIGVPFDAQHFHFGYIRSMAAHLCHTDWVMMLDADERMLPEDLAKLRGEVEAVSGMGKACIAFPRYNWMDGPPGTSYPKEAYPDLQVRCILNNGHVWWRRPVHEVIKLGPDKNTPTWSVSKLHIHHFHGHYRRAKKDDGSYQKIYEEMTKADPDWLGTY